MVIALITIVVIMVLQGDLLRILQLAGQAFIR